MKFFGRKAEIQALRNIREKSSQTAQFTVIVGRRRIGKTSLVLKAYEDEPLLYFFVGRKAEGLLCEEYRTEVEEKLQVRMGGTPKNFAELFSYLLEISKERNITVFIDEFQNFERINASVFSDIQKLWDLNHNNSKLNLIVCGSVYSMMSRIFRDSKEPLYNRQSRFMNISPFTPSVLKEILKEYNPEYSNEDLLALYSFTGGVAKYVSLLVDDEALSLQKMIELIVSPDSIFINEGKSTLIEEFGRDYDTYFSILSSIAQGKTKRSEIEQVLGKQVGGYLTRLENDYGLICKEVPFGAKSTSKNMTYSICDNFFTFWFRFIFKYNYILEINAHERLREIIFRDYTTFSGKILESYYREKLIESKKYTKIGRWWDRKGENEIDLIAENEINRCADIFEIKRNRSNYSSETLSHKCEKLINSLPYLREYELSYRCLDMEDM